MVDRPVNPCVTSGRTCPKRRPSRQGEDHETCFDRRIGSRRDRVVHRRLRGRDAGPRHLLGEDEFNGWPLEHRITITWAACLGGDLIEGNIIGLNDKARNERLRSELARLLRKAEYPLACIWSRDEGARLGLHVHLGLYWPLPDDELVKLLTRLTGSPASYARLEQGVMAQSECGGWQIKRNIAVSRLASAQRWAGYLVDQGKRHLIVPRIKGKVIGVSRSIHYAPVEAQRAALEAWKRDIGWNDAQSAEGP